MCFAGSERTFLFFKTQCFSAAENNIYCYASSTKEGEGIIALRNPSDEPASLTLTLNKLMGCPESLRNVKLCVVYGKEIQNPEQLCSYADKVTLSLAPFEVKILRFGAENRAQTADKTECANDFTISFDYSGSDSLICQNNDIMISVEKGRVNACAGTLRLKSESIISGTDHKITVVREKNGMLKIYIDNFLDCSGYEKRAKTQISTAGLTSAAKGFKVTDSATPYNNIITLTDILKRNKRKFKKEADR